MYLVLTQHENIYWLLAGFCFILAGFQVYWIIRFVSSSHKKFISFLEAIRYSDFTLKFSSQEQRGESFSKLNESFNNVLEAFSRERSEKEQHLQYLKTVVRHISTGLIAYNENGEIELINTIAKKYLGVQQINNIDELIPENSKLFKVIFDVSSGKSILYKGRKDEQITISATSLKIQNKTIKLLALQNIHPELQKIELESWQNLTKILRHEIMNSITPIASLNETMLKIMKEDIVPSEKSYLLDQDSYNDLQEGLDTVAKRTKGLISFVNAYRDYTNIPKPKFSQFNLSDFLHRIYLLLKVDADASTIDFSCSVTSEDIVLFGDEELLEMVVINLIRNAIEANIGNDNTQIKLLGRQDGFGAVEIEVVDNGKGIVPEALDKIFIPFYSTKSTGSGIGLTLSKQIVQMHNGNLNVRSTVDKQTSFIIRL